MSSHKSGESASREVLVQVRVTVMGGDYPELVAREMVVDALASRSAKWTRETFVSESDVEVVDA